MQRETWEVDLLGDKRSRVLREVVKPRTVDAKI